MSDEQLKEFQEQFALQLGRKVDLYHSERHRGIVIVPYGLPLHPTNIITIYQY